MVEVAGAETGPAIDQEGFDVGHSRIEKDTHPVFMQVLGDDEIAAAARFEIVHARQHHSNVNTAIAGFD